MKNAEKAARSLFSSAVIIPFRPSLPATHPNVSLSIQQKLRTISYRVSRSNAFFQGLERIKYRLPEENDVTSIVFDFSCLAIRGEF